MSILPPELAEHQIPSRLVSVSALDEYTGRSHGPVLFVETEADQAGLARLLGEAEYPGLWYADFSSVHEGRRIAFRCVDSFSRPIRFPFVQSTLRYDPARKIFVDPENIRLTLHVPVIEPDSAGVFESEEVLFEAAILSARGGYEIESAGIPCPETISARAEKDLLELVLTGKYPGKAFALLAEVGFVRRFWPEIHALADVEHSREHHPEGGAWLHTLETFRYRKHPDDLLVSFALLLHDTGKPESRAGDGNRFDMHAELGEIVARKFLKRLGYGQDFMNAIGFLVKNHMMPEALPRLPLFRTQEALENPLFPALLELYRCDVSSTFRGPSGYYEASASYRQYLKNVKNPYRTANGKKLQKYYLAEDSEP